jgi:hypothetical protein
VSTLSGKRSFRRSQTIGDLASGKRNAKFGYHAHIIGSSKRGPRGDELLSAQLAKSPDNVMLLCDEHHRIADGFEDDYSIRTLRDMKREHEEWISAVISLSQSSRSEILQFSATIGSNETAIPVDMCTCAMIAAGRTPATFRPIEIKIHESGLADVEPSYWTLELGRLRQRFSELVRGRFERGDLQYLCVFAYGPMPLLMELGRLLSDILEVSVFQRHREPEPGWTWAEDTPPMGLVLNPGEPGPKEVAIKLAISAPITDDRVTKVLGKDVSIWEITCKRPHNDVMRRQDDLSLYRGLVRRAFEDIKIIHGEDAHISIFPTCPMSCAVETGRVWQPKAHLPFDIYDQQGSAGFVHRHRIEA